MNPVAPNKHRQLRHVQDGFATLDKDSLEVPVATKQVDSPFGPLTFINPQRRSFRQTRKTNPLTQRYILY